MLNPSPPKDKLELVVVPRREQVVLAEDSESLLSLILPPIEDLAEIDWLRGRELSIADRSVAGSHEYQVEFAKEFTRLKQKLQRFSDSPTYLNRLASLAALSGSRDDEARFIELAQEISDDPIFPHRIGDNLVARNRIGDAEAVFSKLDLDRDPSANLKLAYLMVQRNDFETAEKRIRRAVEIDPLSFAARLFEGGLLMFKGEYANALHSFRVAQEERNTSSALFGNIGVCYLRLGNIDKALVSLKRAVALDPLNENYISALADISFNVGRSEEALPSLRYFVEFEQKKIDIWARLARACLELGRNDEAIAALKRQSALSDSSAVWNNLGVAYQAAKQPMKALQAFKHSMSMDEVRKGRDYFLAARNLGQAMIDRHEYKVLSRFTRDLIKQDNDGIAYREDGISDLYSFSVFSHWALGERATARAESEKLLSLPNISTSLKIWLISGLITHYVLVDNSLKLALQLIDQKSNWINSLSRDYDERAWMLFNNVAYALADGGRTAEAEKYLSKISKLIHKHAYPTATLGLIQVRKGQLDRGIERYHEAIGLAFERADKARIRQKMNFELGRFWRQLDDTKSRAFLRKVESEKFGEPGLVKAAKAEIDNLELPKKV